MVLRRSACASSACCSWSCFLSVLSCCWSSLNRSAACRRARSATFRRVTSIRYLALALARADRPFDGSGGSAERPRLSPVAPACRLTFLGTIGERGRDNYAFSLLEERSSSATSLHSLPLRYNPLDCLVKRYYFDE